MSLRNKTLKSGISLQQIGSKQKKMNDIHLSRKEIATRFLKLAASGKVQEAYDKYVDPEFYHHNPWFRGDRESLRKGMEDSAGQFPGKIFEVVRALEDGDLVAVHGRVRLKPDMPEIALMHILRFRGDMIIEEWEVSQEVPEGGKNQNGVF